MKATRWTPERLQKYHELLTSKAREIMKAKNEDYKAGSGDPFANFRMASLVRVDERKGVLLRVMDKIARLVTFIDRGTLAVKQESAEDACIDIINYIVILAALNEEANEKEEPCSKPCGAIVPP